MVNKLPFATVCWHDCEVEADADGAGGFVVRVLQGNESLLAIHVPPADKKNHPQYWTAVEWGGLLTRKLWAAISLKERAVLDAKAKAPVVRKWKAAGKEGKG